MARGNGLWNCTVGPGRHDARIRRVEGARHDSDHLGTVPIAGHRPDRGRRRGGAHRGGSRIGRLHGPRPADPRGSAALGPRDESLSRATDPAGWTFDNPSNLARTIHPSGDFAVVLATGDEGTGLPGSGAGPRHSRGYATEQAIHANGQLAFEFDALVRLTAAGRAAGVGHLQTWFLLYHPTPECFRAEVSLPRDFERGRITRWAERILLPPLPRPPTVRAAEWFDAAAVP